MAENVKTVQGLAIASVKTLQGLAIASAKTIMGVDNTGSSGFVAGDYGTVAAWYRAEDVAGSDNDPVNTWEDHGSNNFDLISFGNPPTLKTNILNGYNAIRFDGANDELIAASISTNVGTIVAVIGNVTYSSANAVAGLFTSAYKRVITFFPNSTTIYGGDASEIWGGSTPTRVDGASTYTFPGSPAYAVVSQDGTPAAVTDIAMGYSHVNDHWNGDIVELVLYSNQLSTTNQDNAAASLMTKYGL